jgi:hypothetical protein
MKMFKICRRVIGVLFAVLLLSTGAFILKSYQISQVQQSKSLSKPQTVAVANSKQEKENSLYYRYYMILKSRNKMHKV